MSALDLVARRFWSPDGVWPWAEHNQGLLSVLALICALSIAAWELRQSARRDVRALEDYIDWVVDCADRSLEVTDDAIATLRSGRTVADGGVPMPVWQFLNANALATLEEIQPLRPLHPKLAHHVNRLIRAMAKEVQGSAFPYMDAAALEHFRSFVMIERDHVVALRPEGAWRGVHRRLLRRRG